MNPVAEDILMHIGTATSGRYPKGSGDDPYQHSGDFLSRVELLKNQGLGDTEIAKAMGLSTTQYRAQKSLAKDERRCQQVATAKSLRDQGYSLNAIATKMGYSNDSSVRSLLNENSEAHMNQAKKTADFLKKQVDEKGMIDVGAGLQRMELIAKTMLEESFHNSIEARALLTKAKDILTYIQKSDQTFSLERVELIDFISNLLKD
jgi:orotate phosphoribosyltransferase-like protein